MLTLWGRLNSINVQKAVFALEEIGTPYQRIDAGRGFGVNDTPEYGAMNPNRLVPVLKDGDFVLWESHAIVRYLAAKHPASGLMPEDLQVRADADRWMDWMHTAFNPAFGVAFHGLVRSPGSQRQEAIQDSLSKSEEMAAILDAHLADRAYVAGEAFSMGDIPVACGAHRWFNLPTEKAPRPHMQRWYDEIMTRPAARRVLTLPIT
ncbi:MAG TPA: glutathione S-transferase family protein [Beijerinckiaceae bacterium]|jgi:glutathione S-transferase